MKNLTINSFITWENNKKNYTILENEDGTKFGVIDIHIDNVLLSMNKSNVLIWNTQSEVNNKFTRKLN